MNVVPTTAHVVTETLLRSLAEAERVTNPFRYWLPTDMLDGQSAATFAELPIELPQNIDLGPGRRETNNSTRMFFNAEGRECYPAMRPVAEAFQSEAVVSAFEKLCDIDLSGTNLRIEYCRDTDGFWLEPHTDIGAKRITILIYLSTCPGGDSLGTDLYDAEGRHLGAAPGTYNSGLIFVPGNDTWHGFEKRPIHGVRRCLMANYVGPEWRARHELCFPEQPVR